MKIFFAAISVLVVIVFAGCGVESSIKSGETSKNSLPPTAEVVEEYGNGWLKFKLDRDCFLYYRNVVGSGRMLVIPAKCSVVE